MNGLPHDVDLSFLLGRRLEQICAGEYQVQLRFDEDASVDIEGEYSLNGTRHSVSDAQVLHSLLGLSIKTSHRVGDGDLMLEFGLHILTLHDSNASYESYTLSHGSDVIIV